MIEIRNCSKAFGEIHAIDHVLMEIGERQIFGLVGTNGAGKSTLLRMAAGVIKPDEGEILVDQEPVYENEKIKQQIFYISDGGAIENGTLALRYVCSNKNVTIVIPGMAEEKEIEENIKACLDDSPLSEKELEEVQTVRNQLGTNFCRRCNYCAPCSVGIDISGVFLFAGYLNRYGLGDWARNRYSSLAVKASACIECGKCETRCPYHLPIREMLKECAQQFGE